MAVNLFQFSAIEDSTSNWYKAVPLYESPDVREIAGKHMPTVRRNYGFEFTLARWTLGAAVTVFEESPLARRTELYVAFDRVEIGSYDPNVAPEIGSDLVDRLVTSGEDEVFGEYGIAIGPESAADHFVVVEYGGVLIVADASLLPPNFVVDQA